MSPKGSAHFRFSMSGGMNDHFVTAQSSVWLWHRSRVARAMTAIYFSAALDNTRNLQLGGGRSQSQPRAEPARVMIREEVEQEMW